MSLGFKRLNGDEHCHSWKLPIQTCSAADLTGTQVLTVKSLKHATRHFILHGPLTYLIPL